MIAAFLGRSQDRQAKEALGSSQSAETQPGFSAQRRGLLAGYVVATLKLTPTNRYTKPIMPILVIPIVSTLIVGAVMLKCRRTGSRDS
jgi:fructose-specific phosphotransferase system IIC component